MRADEIPPLLNSAQSGPFLRGGVGAGTGMHGFGFKGGIGSASRRLPNDAGGYTVGVLLNLNSGSRSRLTIAGVPVGHALANELLPVFPKRAAISESSGRAADGSIIVIVATDAPVDARVLHAVAKRVSLGLGRTGWTSTISSGDLYLALSTSNLTPRDASKRSVMLETEESRVNALYAATVDATESAVYDALWNASTMTGRDGITLYGLPHDRVRQILTDYHR